MKLHGILRSRLLHLTWPIFVDTTLIMLLGIGDIFMLGGYSDYAVGAVGVVNQILNMVFLIFGVVTTGTSVLCARYTGASDMQSTKRIVTVSMILNIVFGIVVSICLNTFAEEILGLMEIRDELLPDAVTYMKLVGGFAFLQAISLTFSAILRALQRPKFPMLAILIVNIINIIGNYTLIYGHFGAPELGTEGAAYSTIISRTISVVVLLYSLFFIVLKDYTKADLIKISRSKFREVLNIGLPSAGELISYSTAQVVATYFINTISNEAIIARTYVVNIVMVSYLFAFAVAQSNSIMVGYLVGGRHYNAAHKLTLFSVRSAMIISAVIGLIIALTGKHIVGMITDNAEIIAYTAIVVWIDIALEAGRALNLIVIQALRSANDYIFPVAFGALSVWGIAVGVSYLLGIGYGFGLVGVWIGFMLDENFRGWTMLHRWNKRQWIERVNKK
ncbi:MAG: MATE family efflux transporter [Bacteroidales bacterium]|nr:MATE family efflux transporter [Bacteroidales bacterium]